MTATHVCETVGYLTILKREDVIYAVTTEAAFTTTIMILAYILTTDIVFAQRNMVEDAVKSVSKCCVLFKTINSSSFGRRFLS